MLSLSFEAAALERCFLAADVLAERFGQPFLEYALVGLSTSRRPLHVLHTPLLPGQRVTRSKVEQPGSAVLGLRREIASLSRRMRRRLVPVTFVHRHPGRDCTPSRVDETFLRGAFLAQVSTVLSVPDLPVDASESAPCGCPVLRPERSRRKLAGGHRSVACSLVVSRQRDYELRAAAQHRCPTCGLGWVSDVPAELASMPGSGLSPTRVDGLRKSLELEIRLKFDPRDLEVRHGDPRC